MTPQTHQVQVEGVRTQSLADEGQVVDRLLCEQLLEVLELQTAARKRILWKAPCVEYATAANEGMEIYNYAMKRLEKLSCDYNCSTGQSTKY